MPSGGKHHALQLEGKKNGQSSSGRGIRPHPGGGKNSRRVKKNAPELMTTIAGKRKQFLHKNGKEKRPGKGGKESTNKE